MSFLRKELESSGKGENDFKIIFSALKLAFERFSNSNEYDEDLEKLGSVAEALSKSYQGSTMSVKRSVVLLMQEATPYALGLGDRGFIFLKQCLQPFLSRVPDAKVMLDFFEKQTFPENAEDSPYYDNLQEFHEELKKLADPSSFKTPLKKKKKAATKKPNPKMQLKMEGDEEEKSSTATKKKRVSRTKEKEEAEDDGEEKKTPVAKKKRGGKKAADEEEEEQEEEEEEQQEEEEEEEAERDEKESPAKKKKKKRSAASKQVEEEEEEEEENVAEVVSGKKPLAKKKRGVAPKDDVIDEDKSPAKKSPAKKNKRGVAAKDDVIDEDKSPAKKSPAKKNKRGVAPKDDAIDEDKSSAKKKTPAKESTSSRKSPRLSDVSIAFFFLSWFVLLFLKFFVGCSRII